jgi:hypothetical protein
MICVGLLHPSVAYAYVDPGTGAYLVQLLFTVAGAVVFYVTRPIRHLKALLWRLLGRSGKPPLR